MAETIWNLKFLGNQRVIFYACLVTLGLTKLYFATVDKRNIEM